MNHNDQVTDTIYETRLSPRKHFEVESFTWEEEPFVSDTQEDKTNQRVIRVISIKFEDNSNQVEDVNVRTYGVSQ